MFATPSDRYIFGSVPWYSALIASGILFALWWASREEKRLGLPADTMVDLALRLVPFGIMGARLYYVIFAWDMFKDDLLSILYIWEGGLAIYGGLIAGFFTALVFCHRKRIPFFRVLDAIVPGLAMAQAIGRWGNYFNMEAYGLEISNPALQFFPLAVYIPVGMSGTWHMATFFYESVWNLMIFITLAVLRRRTHRNGDLTCWYLLLYGAGRLVIEELRLDSLMAMDSLRVSQLLSSALCMTVLLLWITRTPGIYQARRRSSTIVAGIVWLAVSAAITFPTAEYAFVGHNALLPVMCALAVAACVLMLEEKRYLQALPATLLTASSLLIKLFLHDDMLSPVLLKILHCAVFALIPVSACAALYPLTTPAAPADTSAPTRA